MSIHQRTPRGPIRAFRIRPRRRRTDQRSPHVACSTTGPSRWSRRMTPPNSGHCAARSSTTPAAITGSGHATTPGATSSLAAGTTLSSKRVGSVGSRRRVRRLRSSRQVGCIPPAAASITSSARGALPRSQRVAYVSAAQPFAHTVQSKVLTISTGRRGHDTTAALGLARCPIGAAHIRQAAPEARPRSLGSAHDR